MQKTRRKKVFLFLLCFILLVLALGYIFRYPLVLQFQHSRLRSFDLKRIWVHRVNSIERYELLKDKFNGFETDIAYDTVTHSYYVYHPPLTRETDTLSLSRFLSKADLAEKRIWLDTRDVYAGNMHEALAAMSKLGDSITLRKGLLIELYDIDAAKLFAQNGYTVSFKLYDELVPRLQANKELLDSMNFVLKEVDYVSQDYRYIPAIRSLFPGKPVLTWDTRFSSFLDRGKLKELLDDPQVAIILVNIKSRYHE